VTPARQWNILNVVKVSNYEVTVETKGHWRLALLLAGAAGLAGAALVPYLLAMLPLLAIAPLGKMVLAIMIQVAVMAFFASWAGLRLGASIGLGWQRPAPGWRAWLGSVAAGVVASLAIVALDAALSAVAPLPAPTPAPSIARWRGLLASPYGGIVEELLTRLFLVTLVARGLMLALRRRTLTAPIAWAAIVVAALLFGAGHLPTAAQLSPLTPPLVLRIVGLNAVGGVVFGWLYWRRGILHAMVAHFAADLVLHVALGG
jgi:membrane protease YdiL (CAAX protease family)